MERYNLRTSRQLLYYTPKLHSRIVALPSVLVTTGSESAKYIGALERHL